MDFFGAARPASAGNVPQRCSLSRRERPDWTAPAGLWLRRGVEHGLRDAGGRECWLSRPRDGARAPAGALCASNREGRDSASAPAPASVSGRESNRMRCAPSSSKAVAIASPGKRSLSAQGGLCRRRGRCSPANESRGPVLCCWIWLQGEACCAGRRSGGCLTRVCRAFVVGVAGPHVNPSGSDPRRACECPAVRRAVTTTTWSRSSTTATLTGCGRAQRSFQPAPVAAYSSTRACISAFRSSIGSSRS